MLMCRRTRANREFVFLLFGNNNNHHALLICLQFDFFLLVCEMAGVGLPIHKKLMLKKYNL